MPFDRASRCLAAKAAAVLGVLLLTFSLSPASAAGPPCNPCAGIRVDDPAAAAEILDGLDLEAPARLYVVWPSALDGSSDNAAFEAVRQAGGTPWTVATFRSPAPIFEHLEALERELEALSALARGAGDRAHFQLDWQPESGEWSARDFGFLFKRAAVVVTGAHAEARVLAGPLAANPATIQAFYAEETAAYVDGIALVPGDEADAVRAVITELDPGKPVVLDSLAWPDDDLLTLAEAAEASQRQFGVALFDASQRLAAGRADAALQPLALLAREFQGDLSFDPYTLPTGAERAFTFVRGDDLSLRVIVESTPGDDETGLLFPDAQLRSPRRLVPGDDLEGSIFGQRRTQTGLFVPIQEPPRVSVLKIERMSAAELEGLEETVRVDDERQMPVEEILARLQAFEDDQRRRIDHYRANNMLHLRFDVGTGAGGVDVSYEGPFFFRQDVGFDWVWQDLYFNGVRWKSEKLPEIPIIQPEKAAVLPLTINFTKEYSYRLRGTDQVEGRDCWVVDFEPIVEPEPGKSLYQGTVWVDRELFARVKTRTLQLGLEDQVLSNDETFFFTPLDAKGQPAAWSADSFFLPTRTVGQQVWSVLNAAIQVERETLLTEIFINDGAFESSRQTALDSEATMVRDTEEGLRYLVKNDEGEREVQEGFDTTRFFLAGGIFYDEGQDFPIPLAGVNYLDLDFRDTGGQLNVLFAGAFLTANIAQPRFLDSDWDIGANANGFFIPLGDEHYRDGAEVPAEEIERRQFQTSFFLGRLIGHHLKADFTYGLQWVQYDEADDTDPSFVLPQDTVTHSFATELTYSRSGYRAKAEATWFQRDDWEFWGLPGNTEFSPEQEDYLKWQVSLGKTWWLPNFRKFGIELEHLDGEDLDRFSKYDFGVFGDADVSGYQNGLVRAEDANGVHFTYGVGIGDVFQVEIDADAVWANDEASGLDNELLAGIGLEGTVIGPWETILNFEIGYAVDGPGEDSVSARLVFLKLFDDFWWRD